MDLKNKRRNILGILIMTLIFGAASIISVLKMFDDQDKEKPFVKKDYVLMLEEELNISLESENDFKNFSQVPFEFLVDENKYQYYYKPCFEFVIVSDGIIIKNGLAKDFISLGFSEGMKITKINDTELAGKSYFEMLELIYSKTEKEIKKFTFSNNTTIDYEYKYYENKMLDEELNVLSVYNFDEITTKAIHETVVAHPDLTLDLTNATVTTLDGIVNFVSLFSKKNEVLFNTPQNIIGQNGRKISELNIVVGNNNDEGILFALTSVNRINQNIKIDKTNLNTTSFYALKVLKSMDYTIYIKNALLEAKGASSSNSGGIEF